ncbi:hypothetical protein FPSE_11235 [Fusarium pseudograminearum CS3096]|uniref:Uncharacterized protein n=1 Tax=Fusarium pseudograminearum (strain CS3096) TaxID=1028729 RepID=K3V685_FUSPC|nr:hypothetical protein FPSE_11235 [Fusarium pseudograminearum CS3096]EKJ68589.1 hypothetical protein FPSE_11235 [Fusarium pseudograminearum CS3096]
MLPCDDLNCSNVFTFTSTQLGPEVIRTYFKLKAIKSYNVYDKRVSQSIFNKYK